MSKRGDTERPVAAKERQGNDKPPAVSANAPPATTRTSRSTCAAELHDRAAELHDQVAYLADSHHE